MLNDKLMLLERVFLLPQGLPDRTIYKNAIFSPSKFNNYGEIQLRPNLITKIHLLAGSSFPGVRDLMHEFDKLDEDEKTAVITRVKKHLSEIMMVFRQAKGWLEDDYI